jgi:hypothetical protein
VAACSWLTVASVAPAPAGDGGPRLMLVQAGASVIELTGRQTQQNFDWFIPLPDNRQNLADARGRPLYMLELAVRNLTTRDVQVQPFFKNLPNFQNVFAYPVIVGPTQRRILRFNPATDPLNVHEFDDYSRIGAVGAKIWGQTANNVLVEIDRARLVPIGAVVEEIPVARSSRSSIKEPKAGARVAPEFMASGTVEIPPAQVAWVAVRIGALYWPKEPAITKSGLWRVKVFEGGVPGVRFFLALIVVDQETDQLINRWFEDGRRSGSFPGLPLRDSAKTLDEIALTKLP